MQPLRYPLLWLVVGYAMVAVAVAGSVGPGVKGVPAALDDKLVHAGVYFVLTIWFSGIYRRSRYPWIAAGLFVLGLLLEFVQGTLPYRSAEYADLAANSAGIVAGLALALAGLGSWCARLESRLFASR